MAPHLFRTAALLLGAALVAVRADAATLQPFRSEAQLARTLDAWQARERASMERQRRRLMKAVATAAPYPPPPAPMMAAPAAEALSMADAGSAASITNNQVQGVDEGDIVKRRGDYLVVLRRGRLFTVRVGGDRLEPVAAVDAFGPDVDPSGTWYDEMLVSDDTVAVIGYSYARGGTEVGVFDLDARGGLRYRATYQLRSHDYYSSRNYASRLVGHRLVFYSPSDLDGSDGWRASLPAYRHWQRNADAASFKRMLPASRVYRGLDELPARLTLHTVSVCDLATPLLACEATAVLGGEASVFHVAEDAVYVWTTGAINARGTPVASVFRMPLDGGAPSMLRAWGSPVDQMGFLQKDGWLNVLVARQGDGDRMWRSGASTGDLALMRVPLSAFGGLDAQARRADFRVLPGVTGYGWQQRFIGDWLVYGGGGGPDDRPLAHVLRYAATSPVQTFALPHALERIEALGGDGLLVGRDGDDLGFTPLRLRGTRASLAGTYRQRGARQGDSRTHGFFYRASDADSGTLGLPVLHGDDRASVLYLRNRSLALAPFGVLEAGRDASRDDGCRASCVDWYGNARPIFLGDRVFALLGYELVEGAVQRGAIRERRRVDFAPRTAIAD